MRRAAVLAPAGAGADAVRGHRRVEHRRILWLYGADQQGPIEPWLCLLVALYSLGAYEPRRHVVQALAVALPIGLAQSIVSQVAGMQAGDVWPSYLFYAIAVGTGRAMRHYRGLTAELHERTIELEHERDVRDDGRGVNGGPAIPGGGHGLAGMRERQIYGGEPAAGRRVDGPGFEVRARLPW